MEETNASGMEGINTPKVVPTEPVKTELEIAIENANARADELGKKMNCKVHSLVFRIRKDSDIIIGFFKDPPRSLKLQLMDNAVSQTYTICSNILESFLIAEESDKRILDPAYENEPYYFGSVRAVEQCIATATNLANTNKKK